MPIELWGQENWIKILDEHRLVAVYRGDEHLQVWDNGSFHQGRKLTEIEKTLSDEVFKLRLELKEKDVYISGIKMPGACEHGFCDWCPNGCFGKNPHR